MNETKRELQRKLFRINGDIERLRRARGVDLATDIQDDPEMDHLRAARKQVMAAMRDTPNPARKSR